MNVLIIDDDRGYALYLMSLCARLAAGGTLHWSENGKEAIAALDQVKPDVIICDRDMPVMGGFETVKAIRSFPRYSRTPILMNSACEDVATKLKAIEAGATRFLQKPIKPEHVQQIARSVSPEAA